ncbi:HAMP domain-containing sensor histidine kinase [Luteitalea sp.]|uniref:sensor histidine kinase n=1 Tax=Luteitalea sp. TaxID=2004800 RepID=UPI0025C6D5A8|nr:HAMP domain-containing sensor histidine kinase [Luteitalea sp.]
MSGPRAWLGSLYWRIALACLGLLAAGLVIQMGVVVATLSRPTGLRARVTAQQLARTVARDLAETLEFDPAVDVREVLALHQGMTLPVFFVTIEGTVTGPEDEPVPPPMARRIAGVAREYAEGLERDAVPVGVAAVEVLGQTEGHIVVLPRRPGWAVLRELGPLTLGSAALMAIGIAALLAWLAFAPAHRRLQALEAAATRLGRGDLTARAPEDGADEISRVSRAFNQTADALATQIRRAASEQHVRRQLLADVSHELHTPLTTIRGYVETLRMTDLPIGDADRARYLGVVDDEAVRLEHLIGDLLDLAKMEAGGQGLRKETQPILTAWSRLRDRFGPAAHHAGVTLTLVESSLAVHADPGRLEQALSNLVGNALRFTPAGGEVRVSAHPLPTGGVRIDVTDTGVGLSVDDQARVFDRFYKQDASRSRSGTGLGLSIVRAIAEAHGGTATVVSTPGRGSTFSVALPP